MTQQPFVPNMPGDPPRQPRTRFGGMLGERLPRAGGFLSDNSMAIMLASMGLLDDGWGGAQQGLVAGVELDRGRKDRAAELLEQTEQEQTYAALAAELGIDPQWASVPGLMEALAVDHFTGDDDTWTQGELNGFQGQFDADGQFHALPEFMQPPVMGPGDGQPRPMTEAERARWGIPQTDDRPYALIDGRPEVIGGSGPSAPGAPDTQTLLGPDGQPHVFGFNPETGRFDIDMGLADPGGSWGVNVAPDGSVSVTQGPVGAGGGATVTQNERQAAAMLPGTVSDFGIVTETYSDLANLGNQIGGAIPLAGNFAVTEDYQRARNALYNILQNYLVVTSGQAVTEQEFARRLEQVLPQPGDHPQTLADKLARVQGWVEAIRNAADRAAGAVPSSSTPSLAPPPPDDPGWQEIDGIRIWLEPE